MEYAGDRIQYSGVRGDERDYGSRDLGDSENVGREGIAVWEEEERISLAL